MASIIDLNTKGFTGVSVTGSYRFREERSLIWVALLCNGLSINPEMFNINHPDWAETLENTINLFSLYIDQNIPNRGHMVYGEEYSFGTRASIVKGEVDKLEIYEIIKNMRRK